MKLIVWNSQGAKWDDLWTNWMKPEISQNQTDDVLCLLAEAGWAPWVAPGDVRVNNNYFYRKGSEDKNPWFLTDCHTKSLLCSNLQAGKDHGLDAIWVPWVKNVAEVEDGQRTNSRCSLGGSYRLLNFELVTRTHSGGTDLGLIRPAMLFDLYKGKNKYPELTVIMIHLLSNRYGAKKELQLLVQHAYELAEGPILFVGDFNYDLSKTGTSLDFPNDEWSVIRTGKPTQQSGGELDYALLWDPKKIIKTKKAAILAEHKSTKNKSDHSVIMYEIA